MNKLVPSRKKVLTALTALLTVSGVVLGSSGTAEAQSGSRICGNYWKAYPNNIEVIYFKVYEVAKLDSDGPGYACSTAISHTDTMDANTNLSKDLKWVDRQKVYGWQCERLGSWLYGKYGNDPCNSINRLDSAAVVGHHHPTILWYDGRNSRG